MFISSTKLLLLLVLNNKGALPYTYESQGTPVHDTRGTATNLRCSYPHPSSSLSFGGYIMTLGGMISLTVIHLSQQKPYGTIDLNEFILINSIKLNFFSINIYLLCTIKNIVKSDIIIIKFVHNEHLNLKPNTFN